MKDAELLERVLEGTAPPDLDVPAHVDRLAMLADVLGAAAAPAAVERMPASSRTDIRNALLREANLRAAAPPPLLTRIREAVTGRAERVAYSSRVAVSSSVAAVVLSGGGVAAAAQASLPGDLLYGVKLAAEDMMLSFSDDGLGRGSGLLAQADSRIEEAGRAVDRGDPQAAAEALALADERARAAAQEYLAVYLDTGDVSVLADLGRWVISTNRRLDLLPELTGMAAKALEDLRTSLNRIGQRIEVLTTGACTSCDLGVHDDPEAEDTARGREADGTPPVPGGSPVDLTFIPPADAPFQACPCAPPVPPGAATPVPAAPGTPQPTSAPPPPPSSPPPAGGPPPGGSPGGGGGGSGGGSRPLPLPELAPVTDRLPDPVRDAVEEIIEQIPAQPPSAETPGAAPAPQPAPEPAQPQTQPAQRHAQPAQPQPQPAAASPASVEPPASATSAPDAAPEAPSTP